MKTTLQKTIEKFEYALYDDANIDVYDWDDESDVCETNVDDVRLEKEIDEDSELVCTLNGPSNIIREVYELLYEDGFRAEIDLFGDKIFVYKLKEND